MLRKSVFISSFICLFLLVPLSFAERYRGFRELDAKDCIALAPQSVQKLSTSWRKYIKFIKVCPLRSSPESPAKVSVVSIWTDDYMNAQPKKIWEDFPLSILVDQDLNEVGTLPEIFPMDSRTEPRIYYGKWKSGLPTEIKIDVFNPTVSGNYYYSPLTWDEKIKRYRMTDNEPKFGSRQKH